MEENGRMKLRVVRQGLVPRISCMEVARRIGVSHAFWDRIERGVDKCPAPRLARFNEIVAAWQTAPDPRPRKVRKDTGKRHRWRKKLRSPKAEPVPVPHSRGEVVGIG